MAETQPILKLSKHWSFGLRNDPKRLPFVLARYAFAAGMGCRPERVLELGCSEGLGATILAEGAERYLGVDVDSEAIHAAQRNWTDPRFEFVEADFLGQSFGQHDLVVSLDVVEHIEPDEDWRYFQALTDSLSPKGVAVVGTPNVTSSAYASPASQAGHINLFTQAGLAERMRERFEYVFAFGMNDEVVHTGYAPMCHYIYAVGCGLKLEAK